MKKHWNKMDYSNNSTNSCILIETILSSNFGPMHVFVILFHIITVFGIPVSCISLRGLLKKTKDEVGLWYQIMIIGSCFLCLLGCMQFGIYFWNLSKSADQLSIDYYCAKFFRYEFNRTCNFTIMQQHC